MAKDPLQYFPAILCLKDPVAFGRHLSLQEFSHIGITVRYQYRERVFIFQRISPVILDFRV